ncbi:hypothetical protein GCM10023229_05130 [Flavisolibacter ginsenosidimutans]
MVGTTVTIQGSNFNPLPANNIVWFGAVRATVLTASSTSLSVVVPKGANRQAFTVTNTVTGLTGFATDPFNVTFPGGDPYFSTKTFGTAATFPGAPGAVWVAIGDLDADGKPDLVTTSDLGATAFTLAFLRNTSAFGKLSFAPKTERLMQGLSGRNILLADLNGDGLPELVAACDGTIYVLKNTSSPGTISFAPPLAYTAPQRNESLDVADMDNDGKPDIMFTNQGKVQLLHNTTIAGALSFNNPENLSTAPFAATAGEYLKLYDFDRDGRTDIALLSSQNDSLVFFRNNSSAGNILFDNSTRYSLGTGSQGVSLAAGDLDGDGIADLSVACYGTERISNYLNKSVQGTIAFEPATGVAFLYQTQHVTTGDINGDGKQDIAADRGHSGSSRTVAVLANKSIGCRLSFDPISPFVEVNVQTNDPNLLLSDLTADGKPELITTQSISGYVLVYENKVEQTFAACAGAALSLSSSLTGNTYQWQQNSGSGFVPLSNNADVSGTQTSVLQLSRLPLNWNGYLFRAVVDGDTSNVYKIAVAAVLQPAIKTAACPLGVCGPSGPLSLSADVENIGSTGAVRWQDSTGLAGWTDITGAITSQFLYTAAKSGSKIRCRLTSSLPCASQAVVYSVPFTVQSLSSVTPGANIVGNTFVVQGQTTSLTAQVINGGVNPSYQWQDSSSSTGWKNIINGTSSTLIYTALQSGTKIRCLVTSAASCAVPNVAISNVLTLTVNTPTAIIAVQPNDAHLLVFPNPVRNQLVIDSLRAEYKFTSLQIISASGQLIMPSYSLTGLQRLQLSVATLPGGPYLLMFHCKNGRVVYRQFLKL